MSYLDPPRFHFAGTFWTNPSTINNATENYALGTQYNNNPPSQANPESVWWNQYGQAFFKITQAAVSGACLTLGTIITSGDPVIGASVVSVPTGANPPHNGRLVDLDPDQQARSLVVGMRIQITTSQGVVISGTFRPMTITDLWGRVIGGGGGGITTAGAMYQSVLDDVQWTNMAANTSPLLAALYAASPNTLSIKFNVDAYNGTLADPNFGDGRIVGTIGPYAAGEAIHQLAKRKMSTGSSLASPNSPLNATPFQLARNYVTIDLGNSIPVAAPYGGPFYPLGTVSLIAGLGVSPKVIADVFTSPTQFQQLYDTTAGVMDVPVGPLFEQLILAYPVGLQITPDSGGSTPGQFTGLQARSLKTGLTVPNADATAGTTIGAAENPDGIFVFMDFNALRLQNGAPAWSSTSASGTEITATVQVPLYATDFGSPAGNRTIGIQSTQNVYQFNQANGQPMIINNTPMSAITAPASVTTNAGGVALATFTANALTQQQLDTSEPRRSALNSQLYLFTHDDSMDTIGQPLTLLVFIDTAGPSGPTWTRDIGPIFTQYAQLYPAMKQMIDLSDYATVVANIGPLQTVMNLPMDDPGYMPVTRDLSLAQLATLNAWFANPQQ